MHVKMLSGFANGHQSRTPAVGSLFGFDAHVSSVDKAETYTTRELKQST